MVTREQMLLQQREKHLERAASSQKKAKQIEKVLAAEKRRKENRQKYIAGGYLLKALLENETPCQTYEELLEILDRTLTKDIDRRAFNLPELSKKSPKFQRKQPKARKSKTKKEDSIERVVDDSLPNQPHVSTLPASLVASTVERGTTSLEGTMASPKEVPPSAKPSKQAATSPAPPKSKVLPEKRDEDLIEEFNL